MQSSYSARDVVYRHNSIWFSFESILRSESKLVLVQKNRYIQRFYRHHKKGIGQYPEFPLSLAGAQRSTLLSQPEYWFARQFPQQAWRMSSASEEKERTKEIPPGLFRGCNGGRNGYRPLGAPSFLGAVFPMVSFAQRISSPIAPANSS